VSAASPNMTLAFPESKAFSKRKAEQDDYRRTTAEALKSVLGTSLVLRYELRGAEDLPEPQGASAAESGLSQEELVRRLVEEFDAQEVVLDDPPDPESRP
jgi:hypothetical protein